MVRHVIDGPGSEMAKLSDADRLARLLGILQHLRHVERATVAELAARFGGSPRSLYEDLLAAWIAEDPAHTGMFPLHLNVEYFGPDDPERKPVSRRECWLSAGPGDQALRELLEQSWRGRSEADEAS